MIFIITFISTNLFANIGALLFIDSNTKPIMGFYTSEDYSSTNVSVQSTDNSIDNEQHSFNHSSPIFGVFVGLKNNYHRLTLSYDYVYHESIEQSRLLFNLDFYDTRASGWEPLVGIGIGASDNKYYIHNRTIKQSNGVVTLKAGTSWNLKENNSIDFTLEYAKLLTNNVGKSISENGEFTTYNINKKNETIFRLGYCTEF